MQRVLKPPNYISSPLFRYPTFFWQNAHLLIEHGIFGHLCGNAPNWYIITGKKIRNKILEVTAVLQVFNCFLSNNKSHHLNFKLLDLSFKRKALQWNKELYLIAEKQTRDIKRVVCLFCLYTVHSCSCLNTATKNKSPKDLVLNWFHLFWQIITRWP